MLLFFFWKFFSELHKRSRFVSCGVRVLCRRTLTKLEKVHVGRTEMILRWFLKFLIKLTLSTFLMSEICDQDVFTK